jgi:hypothetical protein
MSPHLTPDDVLSWLPRRIASTWKRLSARARRVAWISVGVPLVLLATALPAYADGSTSPSALSWINVEDSHGISIWQYEMSLDRGGVRNPVRAVWAIFIDMSWQLYRGYIALACWLVDWTLSMDWLGWVAGPVMDLGDGLHQVVARFGATTTLLTLTAVVAVLWMARGRWVTGIFELGMSLVIASLAVGILANPVRLVAGEDGMLMNSRDAGMSIAAGLQDGGDTTTADSDALRSEVTGMLAETFLRKPQQVVNFGEVIDGTKCEKDYNEVLTDGPYGDDDDIRNAVGDCDGDLGDVAEHPNAGMFMSLGVLMPAGFVAVTFTAILCGAVLIAGLYALYQSLKMIVALVMALLPGGARGSLWMTIAELIISMVTIVFSIVFLAAYLMLIQTVFSNGDSPMATFFIMDVLLLAGIVVFLKGRKRIKASADRLAQAMAKRPGTGGGASRLPGRTPISYTDLYYKGRIAAQSARTAGAIASGASRTAGQAAAGAGRVAYGPVDRTLGRLGFAAAAAAAAAPAPGQTTGKAASPGRDSEAVRASLSDRVDTPRASRRGQLVKVASQVATQAALVAATGGTSAAASAGTGAAASRAATRAAARAATQTAQQAAISGTRRAALSSQLRPALPAGSRSDRSTPGAPGEAAGNPGGTSSTSSATGPARVVPGQVVPGRVVRTRTGSDLAASPVRQVTPPGSNPAASAPATTALSAEDQLRARLDARLGQRRAIALGPVKPRD